MTVEAVICHIRSGDRILLQKKATGLFGEGKWNGVGGKLDEGESPLDCVLRETEEESGLRIESPKELGSLQFFRKSSNKPDWLVHVFLANQFKGRITRSREGELKWFNVKALPFETMWPDDRFWLFVALEERTFKADFLYDKSFSKLLGFRIVSP